MKPSTWCRKHDASPDMAAWCEQFDSMADAWEACQRSDWMLWAMGKEGVGTDAEYRLLACRFVREVWHLLTDERSRNAVIVAGRYARGEATDEELADAEVAAWDAVADVVTAAEQAIARAEDVVAMWAVAMWAAARAAAVADATERARARQADIIREMIPNPWKAKS